MSLRTAAGKAGLVAGVVALLACGQAQAFSGVSVGDPVTGVLSSVDISVNALARCAYATVGGTIASDAGAGNGGTISIASMTLSSCTAGSIVTANALPSTMAIGSASTVSWSGVDLTGRNGSIVCSYRGTLTGPYNPLNGVFAITGGLLTRYAGISACGATTTVSGSFMLSSGGSPIAL